MYLAFCLLGEKCNHQKLKSENFPTKVNPLNNEMLNLACCYLLLNTEYSTLTGLYPSIEIISILTTIPLGEVNNLIVPCLDNTSREKKYISHFGQLNWFE